MEVLGSSSGSSPNRDAIPPSSASSPPVADTKRKHISTSVSTLFPLPVTVGHEVETKRKQVSTSEALISNESAGYDGGCVPMLQCSGWQSGRARVFL